MLKDTSVQERKIPSVLAVSYTHLDVYKRQAWVFAPDHISDLFWKRELLFSDNLFVFYNIDGDIVIDKT